MPRPIWSGSISFGLVNVPIKLFSAVSPQDVRFHQLRKSDGSRIRQKRVSAADGAEVAYEEIVKGYEVGPEQYVLVDPEELAALDPKATQTIDIEEFVDLDQIDPIFYEHPYYLVPDKRAEKAYALLREAMRRTNKVAIARFVMRTKQYLAAVRPGPDGVLVLSTMLYADEVVPVDRLEGLPGPDSLAEVSDRELQMASALVESLTAESFAPEAFHDTYRQRVLELIDAKAAGQTVTAPAAAADAGGRVVDLMAALEASVQAAKERRAAEGSAAATAGSSAADAPVTGRRRRSGGAQTARARTDGTDADATESEAVEKPARGAEPSHEVSIGRYLYTGEFFDLLEEGWAKHRGGEYYHTYALDRLIAADKVAFVRASGLRLDTGDPSGYLEAVLHDAAANPALRPVLERFARENLGGGRP